MDKLTETTHNQKLGLWINRIKECRASDLTVAQWCKQQNFSVKTYYYWMKKIKRELLDASLPTLVESPIKQQFPLEQPVFSKVQTMTEGISGSHSSNTLAATIRIQDIFLDIHSGADQSTIEMILLTIKRVC